MNTFQGKDGRDWTIDISSADLSRLRTEISIDLMEIVDGDGDLFQQLQSDPVKLATVLYAILQPQDCDFEAFANQLGGESLDDAHDTLMAALLDFFPRAHRETLKAILKTSKESQRKVMEVLNGPAVGKALTAEIENLESQLLRTLSEHGSASIN